MRIGYAKIVFVSIVSLLFLSLCAKGAVSQYEDNEQRSVAQVSAHDSAASSQSDTTQAPSREDQAIAKKLDQISQEIQVLKDDITAAKEEVEVIKIRASQMPAFKQKKK